MPFRSVPVRWELIGPDLLRNFDFGTQGLVVMEFTTKNLDVLGGRVQFEFQEADLGTAGVPAISVLEPTIRVILDTDASNGATRPRPSSCAMR
jgi:hypothetical protein